MISLFPIAKTVSINDNPNKSGLMVTLDTAQFVVAIENL